MSETIQAYTVREDQEDETRIVELSSSYDGTSGCYHWLARKLVIFEQGEVVIQWHNGVNAPVDVRLTFAELDALIAQFNTYCEDFNHTLPDDPGLFALGSVPSLVLVQTVVPVPEVITEPCGGSCWICDNPCCKPENHHESCYCSAHT